MTWFVFTVADEDVYVLVNEGAEYDEEMLRIVSGGEAFYTGYVAASGEYRRWCDSAIGKAGGWRLL